MRESVLRMWRAVPCKLLWAFVAVCALVQEWYPFSHFPMYSNFEPHTYYIYLADSEDRPVALQSEFGIRTSNFKKIYDRKLRELGKGKPRGTKSLTPEERAEAGRYAIGFLRQNSVKRSRAQAFPALKLYEVQIRMEGGAIRTEARAIAEG